MEIILDSSCHTGCDSESSTSKTLHQPQAYQQFTANLANLAMRHSCISWQRPNRPFHYLQDTPVHRQNIQKWIPCTSACNAAFPCTASYHQPRINDNRDGYTAVLVPHSHHTHECKANLNDLDPNLSCRVIGLEPPQGCLLRCTCGLCILTAHPERAILATSNGRGIRQHPT
jgi:hypothetical protein